MFNLDRGFETFHMKWHGIVSEIKLVNTHKYVVSGTLIHLGVFKVTMSASCIC